MSDCSKRSPPRKHKPTLCFLFPAKPSVHLFSKKSRIEGNIILSCMATGFYPNTIILQIKRNDRILTRDDGVITTGIRPNEDSTYQRKDSVEILRSDPSQYTCEVIHQASKLNIETKWGKRLIVLPFVTACFLSF